MADLYEEMKTEPLSSPLPAVVLPELKGSLGEGEWLIGTGKPFLRSEALTLTL